MPRRGKPPPPSAELPPAAGSRRSRLCTRRRSNRPSRCFSRSGASRRSSGRPTASAYPPISRPACRPVPNRSASSRAASGRFGSPAEPPQAAGSLSAGRRARDRPPPHQPSLRQRPVLGGLGMNRPITILLAERRKPPGSGANACRPVAKNVGVEVPGSTMHIERLADRAAYAAPLETDRATARYLASGFSRAFTMPRRGRNRSAQGRARRRSALRRPGLTVPPKFFALKGRDKRATSSESSVIVHNGEPLFPSIRSHPF
jgi:hypothetical protein